MKKLTLLIVLLVAVGMTAGFALEMKPSFTLTGSATLTWGIDLNTGGHTGFNNAGTATLTVNLLPDAGKDAHTGKGQIYGSITISNLELYWTGTDIAGSALPETGDAPSVSAQVFVTPFEIGVNSAPTMYTDAAAIIEDTALTGVALIDNLVMHDEASFYGATGIYTTGQKGTYVKYAGTGFWAKLDMASKGTWLTNTTDSYAFGGEGSVTIGPITANVGLFQGINWAPNPLAGYVSASSTVPGFGPVSAGLDWQVTSSVFTWEVGASAQFNFNKEATSYVLGKVYYDPQIATHQGFDSKLVLMVPSATLMGPVNFDVTFYLLDLATTAKTMDMAALVNLGYKQALQGDVYIQPKIGLNFANFGDTNTSALSVSPAVVLGLAAAPATTLTLAWGSGDLMLATPGMGALTLALAVTY